MIRFYIVLLLVLAGCTQDHYVPQATELGDALVAKMNTYENFHYKHSTREMARNYPEGYDGSKGTVFPMWEVFFDVNAGEVTLTHGNLSASYNKTISYHVLISVGNDTEKIRMIKSGNYQDNIFDYNSTITVAIMNTRPDDDSISNAERTMYFEMVKQMIMNITV